MGPTSTGDGAVPAESPRPREEFLCDGCRALQLEAHSLGREKGAALVEMNFSSKRGCAGLRKKTLQALTQWCLPAEGTRSPNQTQAGFTPGT